MGRGWYLARGRVRGYARLCSAVAGQQLFSEHVLGAPEVLSRTTGQAA
jgi:hypothetical protein